MSVEEVIDGQRTIRTVDASDVTDKNEKIAYAVVDGQMAIVTTVQGGGGGGTTLTATQVTLDSDDWSSNAQTVTVVGVKPDNIVFVSPAPSSVPDYSSAGIYCSAQGADELTFICSEVPSNDVVVNVVYS